MRVSETWEASRRSALPCLPNNSQGALWMNGSTLCREHGISPYRMVSLALYLA